MSKRGDGKNEKEVTLLQELCGGDAELYACLSTRLYETPFAAISKKELDILTQEARTSGNFGPAMDKVIFEGAQNPGERERYVRLIQSLARDAVDAMEQQRDSAGPAHEAASLARKIKDQKLISERAEDILSVASKFYNEKLADLKETRRREAQEGERKAAEREDRSILKLEKAERAARKKERKGMGRKARREAKKEARREELAAEKRKEAREEERNAAEAEERKARELEEAARQAREEERRGTGS
jgi:hypothetical protein